MKRVLFCFIFWLYYQIKCESLIYRESHTAGLHLEEHIPRAKNHRYDDYEITLTTSMNTTEDFDQENVNDEEGIEENHEKFHDEDPPIAADSRQDEFYESFGEDLDHSYQIQQNLNSKRQQPRKKCSQCKCGIQPRARSTSRENGRMNDFPWIALLAYFGRFYCAGTLVNNLYIVTAGHCTRGYLTIYITARFFEHERDISTESPDFVRKIARAYRPIGFNDDTLNNDISLLKLARAVPVQGEIIRPICLPVPKSSFRGQQGTIARWGTTFEDYGASAMLKIANVPIIANKRCRTTDRGDTITEKMICALNPRRNEGDACSGDSGGPLMVIQNGRFRLAGIVSSTKGCGRKNLPSVYTRVTKFNRWIRQLSVGACWCG